MKNLNKFVIKMIFFPFLFNSGKTLELSTVKFTLMSFWKSIFRIRIKFHYPSFSLKFINIFTKLITLHFDLVFFGRIFIFKK